MINYISYLLSYFHIFIVYITYGYYFESNKF